jgi:hypothetical protein
MPSVDYRAAELNGLSDRQQYQETDQPRGREDLRQDALQHLADDVAGSHLRFRDECAHARLNGAGEGGLEPRRTIGRISRRRNAA